jgi:predicted ester cyclase
MQKETSMVLGRFVPSPRTTPVNAGILIRRYFEDILGNGDLDGIEGLVAPDVVFTTGYHPRPQRGIEALKAMITGLHESFSGIIITEKVSISEGEIVANRWIFRGTHTGTFMGVAPTARSVRVAGMAFCRVSHERIVEIWVTDDSLTMLTQLGAILFP